MRMVETEALECSHMEAMHFSLPLLDLDFIGTLSTSPQSFATLLLQVMNFFCLDHCFSFPAFLLFFIVVLSNSPHWSHETLSKSKRPPTYFSAYLWKSEFFTLLRRLLCPSPASPQPVLLYNPLSTMFSAPQTLSFSHTELKNPLSHCFNPSAWELPLTPDFCNVGIHTHTLSTPLYRCCSCHVSPQHSTPTLGEANTQYKQISFWASHKLPEGKAWVYLVHCCNTRAQRSALEERKEGREKTRKKGSIFLFMFWPYSVHWLLW